MGTRQFGMALRARREAKGMSASELARHAGITGANVLKNETDRGDHGALKRGMGIATAYKISVALGWDLTEMGKLMAEPDPE